MLPLPKDGAVCFDASGKDASLAFCRSGPDCRICRLPSTPPPALCPKRQFRAGRRRRPPPSTPFFLHQTRKPARPRSAPRQRGLALQACGAGATCCRYPKADCFHRQKPHTCRFVVARRRSAPRFARCARRPGGFVSFLLTELFFFVYFAAYSYLYTSSI